MKSNEDLTIFDEYIGNEFNIFDIQLALYELKKLDFNILSNKYKYNLYKELINIYEVWYDVDNSNYEERVKKYYDDIMLDIFNNIKYFFSLLQTTKLENIIIELMKPARVLNRLTSYEDWEPC